VTEEELETQFEPPESRRAHPLVAVSVILTLAAMSWLPFFGGCS
jgi:hypothetical protein